MSAGKAQRPVVAVDLGGTKIIAALVSPAGEVTARERAPSSAANGPQAVIARIITTINWLLSNRGLSIRQVEGLCVAAAGPTDMTAGVVTASPNLPGWENVPLRDIMREQYQTNAYLINDAKAAALGEHRFGAGKGVENMLGVTLGTGIGGGIVIHGRLYFGESGGAGEVGHMTVEAGGPRCTCGNTGCWELYASGTAMAKEAARRVAAGEKSALAGKPPITGEDVAAAAAQGDAVAQAAVERTARYLGIGLASLVNIFNPRMIVIGGGLSRMGETLLSPARLVVLERAFPLLSGACEIVVSTLGDDAGLLGAAAFAFAGGKV